jgi:hypothetical protein
VNVSAAHVKDSFLDPAMDARALNLNQAFRLTNQTPECDSLLEHLARIHPDGPSERFHLQQMHALAVVVVAENETEGQIEQRIARSADLLSRDLRGVELNGASGVLTAKAIARRLRGPLQVLVDVDELGAHAGHPGTAILDAAFAVGDVLRLVPSRQLLQPQVEHELRGRLFEKLRDLHSSAAPSEGTSPAADRPALGGQLAPGTLLPGGAS